MKELFCGYCHKFKPSEGFKSLRHAASGTPRRMCPACQAVRKLPPAERERLRLEAKKEDQQRKLDTVNERLKEDQARRDYWAQASVGKGGKDPAQTYTVKLVRGDL